MIDSMREYNIVDKYGGCPFGRTEVQENVSQDSGVRKENLKKTLGTRGEHNGSMVLMTVAQNLPHNLKTHLRG